MGLYVVTDLMGNGRIVGVFDSEAAAREVVGAFPQYYKIHVCRLNELDAEALAWAQSDEQRRWLAGVLERRARGR